MLQVCTNAPTKHYTRTRKIEFRVNTLLDDANSNYVNGYRYSFVAAISVRKIKSFYSVTRETLATYKIIIKSHKKTVNWIVVFFHQIWA